jgi:hypothetical protein
MAYKNPKVVIKFNESNLSMLFFIGYAFGVESKK